MCIEGNKKTIAWCEYCKEQIVEGEGSICVDGEYFHFDKENPVKNCYFKEEEDNV